MAAVVISSDAGSFSHLTATPLADSSTGSFTPREVAAGTGESPEAEPVGLPRTWSSEPLRITLRRAELLTDVFLHVYNLGTSGTFNVLNPLLRPIGLGAFHCGVEVYGWEWSYLDTRNLGDPDRTGIYPCRPSCSPGHSHYEKVSLGETALSERDVIMLVKRLEGLWHGMAYDCLRKNCGHFCQEFCRDLGVQPLPAWVISLTATAQSVSASSCCRLCPIGPAAREAGLQAAHLEQAATPPIPSQGGNAAGADDAGPQIAAAPLAAYFQGEHLAGGACDVSKGSEYVYSFQFQAPVLEHLPTGIFVLDAVVDMRGAALGEPSLLLYHYTGRTEFDCVADAIHDTGEVFAALSDRSADAAEGIFASSKEPREFQDRSAIYCHVLRLRAGGGGGGGSPRGSESAQIRLSVDFCIPLLVPTRFVHTVPQSRLRTPRTPRQVQELTQQPVQDDMMDWSFVKLPEAERSALGETHAAARFEAATQWIVLRETKLGPRSLVTLSTAHHVARQLQRIPCTGALVEAELLQRRALDSFEAACGLQHPGTVSCLRSLAGLLRAMGRGREAEAAQGRALGALEAMLGKEHPETLGAVTDFATLLRESGRYREAEPLQRRSAAGLQAALGPRHPRTLSASDNLAVLWRKMGYREKAEPLQVNAWQGRSEVLGAQHSDTLASLSNLALLMMDLGRLEEAEPLHQQTLKGREASLGAEHPSTLATLNNLALLLKVQGRLDESEPLSHHAWKGLEAKLGPSHRSTLIALSNLANVLRAQRRFDEAEPLCRQALETREATLASTDRDVLASKNNFALLLASKGRYVEAEELQREVLEGRESAFGPNDGSTLGAASNLARLLIRMGKEAEAITHYRRLLEAREQTLGRSHERTLTALDGLARALAAGGQQDEAVPLRWRAWEARKATLGSQHPKSVAALERLAKLLQDAGRLFEAESLYKTAVEGRVELHGAVHPRTMRTRGGLALTLLLQMRRASEAPSEQGCSFRQLMPRWK